MKYLTIALVAFTWFLTASIFAGQASASDFSHKRHASYSRSMVYAAAPDYGPGPFSTVAGIVTFPVKIAAKIVSGGAAFTGSTLTGGIETIGGFTDGAAPFSLK